MTAPRRAATTRRSRALGPGAPPSASPPAPAAVARPSPDQRAEGAPPGEPSERAEPAGGAPFDGQYRIKLDAFEGPLDLLLHLIQEHELDILDIPVSFITEKYLEYLKLMRVLSIEIASEYLVMAATLVHIKSKMLLPVAPAGQDDGMPQEEEEDPRAELVRRLLEYQKYKAAAAELAERGTLGRDVFPRGVEEAPPPGPAEFAKVEVFSLLEAFEKILKRAKIKIDHEVVFDRISITDRILELTDKLQGRRAVRFEWLFLSGARQGVISRFDLVITFLAMLEMCRMRLLRVYQTGPLAPIYLGLVDEAQELSEEDRQAADLDADAGIAAPPEPAAEAKTQVPQDAIPPNETPQDAIPPNETPQNDTAALAPPSEEPVNQISSGPSPGDDEATDLPDGPDEDVGDETVTELQMPDFGLDRRPAAGEDVNERETLPWIDPPESVVPVVDESATEDGTTPVDPDTTEVRDEVTDDD